MSNDRTNNYSVKRYESETAFFVFGFVFGLIISSFDKNLAFSLANITVPGIIFSGYFGFIVFQIQHNRLTKRQTAEWFTNLGKSQQNLRRVADPIVLYSDKLVVNFLRLVQNAKKVYSLDRNIADTWFTNENLMAFLCLQEALIQDNDMEAYRVFVWEKECFYQSQFQQLLMLNVYAKVKTYIVTLEFLIEKKDEFMSYVVQESAELPSKMNVSSHFREKWLDVLLNHRDGEEFLICETQTGETDGIGKDLHDRNVIDRPLNIYERELYILFCNWLFNMKTNGNPLLLLDKVPPNIDFSISWRKKIADILDNLNTI